MSIYPERPYTLEHSSRENYKSVNTRNSDDTTRRGYGSEPSVCERLLENAFVFAKKNRTAINVKLQNAKYITFHGRLKRCRVYTYTRPAKTKLLLVFNLFFIRRLSLFIIYTIAKCNK